MLLYVESQNERIQPAFLCQNILFKDVLVSALKMDARCGGLLCAVSIGASSQWRQHRAALNEHRDLVSFNEIERNIQI